MPRPTFLGIGAQKTGTTWLASLVSQHPDVTFSDEKEVHFFDRPERYELGTEWYERQFPVTPGALAIGEFTPAYLWTTGDPEDASRQGHLLETAQRVAELYPDIRLIVSFRNPVSRAVSGMFQSMKLGRFPPGTPLMEAARLRPGIVEKGRYASNLAVWLRHFPREQFLFLVYEDDILPDDAKPDTLRRTFRHIGVSPSYQPGNLLRSRNPKLPDFELHRRNAGRFLRPAMKLLPDFIRDLRYWDIPRDVNGERELWDLYQDDIAELERMIDRALPWGPPVA